MTAYLKFFLRSTGCALALATSSVHADVELTDLPGVAASANSCYLSACDVPGLYVAANAIDNLVYSPSTGGHAWNAGDAGTLGDANWLRVDFGATYSLSSTDLRFAYNGGNWAGYSNVYELRSSVDGSQWQTIAGGTFVDGSIAGTQSSFAWTGIDRPIARWVEYRVVGGSHWSALDEINVMGSPAIAAVPEPSSWGLMALGLLSVGAWVRRRGVDTRR